VIPDEFSCLVLADSLHAWIAPQYRVMGKEQPVTSVRTLAAQMDDQRCQHLWDKMDQNEHSRCSETKEGLLERVASMEGAT